VCLWVDGIHLKVCVRADGTKELVALADGFRESTESWAGLLRSCRRRGVTAPVLAVGDGALGFWKGSRAAGVAMAFKLIESAQARWRAVNAPHLVALVRAGARFEKGKLVERPDESRGDQSKSRDAPIHRS
jgi:hypothetical protein